ncbi:AGE family epimerase/isomerase [Marivivens donghaensis]|uniref:AGE family epimerase/isomerase n=1 Tax=Marivivens donghaensis TaxID=1699413 RepID=A0ABX0W241_9RHOB|nr:AGE family epimerase/isomerase [Marivivens donghaensis]NIY73720.1 AGE family epimerase/isomerase [Marivivens donghaensis]
MDASDYAALDSHLIDEPRFQYRLRSEAEAQLAFFRRSLRADGGFDLLAFDGTPITGQDQGLTGTARHVYSYALAKSTGHPDCDDMIDAGLTWLDSHFRDKAHGGFYWTLNGTEPTVDHKMAYGHVHVLLAASAATQVGHPLGPKLLEDLSDLLLNRFMDSSAGLLADEFSRDWSYCSAYRGYNANMHGLEAYLAAYETTGDTGFLTRAEQVIDFFANRIARANHWRVIEHFDANWSPDMDYDGHFALTPRGTTPGHSFELARLMIQYWDLAGRPRGNLVFDARSIIDTALSDAWDESGGISYTLEYDGRILNPARYWWPVTEAILAIQALIKVAPMPNDEGRFRRLWDEAEALFIDHDYGGWFHEVAPDGTPTEATVRGKPDLYHSIQAAILPAQKGVTRIMSA